MTANGPLCFVQSRDDIFRQRTFRAIVNVILQLLHAAGTKDHSVFRRQLGVMLAPTKSNLSQTKPVFILL